MGVTLRFIVRTCFRLVLDFMPHFVAPSVCMFTLIHLPVMRVSGILGSCIPFVSCPLFGTKTMDPTTASSILSFHCGRHMTHPDMF